MNNVLDYERIEMGRFEMSFREVNLRETFQEVVTGFKPLSGKKNVHIKLEAVAVRAVVDEDRIKQVLTNLLSNALYFSPTTSLITVTLGSADGFVNASVENRGCGVPDEEREKIFHQFYTKGVKDGTGLGLAICRGIIEAHRGEIGVGSGVAGGSRFWFRLPNAREEATADEQATSCGR